MFAVSQVVVRFRCYRQAVEQVACTRARQRSTYREPIKNPPSVLG